MNSNKPRSKTGVFDNEINYISKLLFCLMLVMSIGIQQLKGFHLNI